MSSLRDCKSGVPSRTKSGAACHQTTLRRVVIWRGTERDKRQKRGDGERCPAQALSWKWLRTALKNVFFVRKGRGSFRTRGAHNCLRRHLQAKAALATGLICMTSAPPPLSPSREQCPDAGLQTAREREALQDYGGCKLSRLLVKPRKAFADASGLGSTIIILHVNTKNPLLLPPPSPRHCWNPDSSSLSQTLQVERTLPFCRVPVLAGRVLTFIH